MVQSRSSEAVLAFFVLFVIVRGCFFRPSTVYSGEYFNRGENAVWLGVEWVKETHTQEEIEALANNLRRQQVRYVFVFTTYLKPNSEFNSTYAYSAGFVTALKTAYPEVIVLAWLGLPLKNSDIFNEGYVDLEESSIQLQIASFSAKIIKEGRFDGVHLDPEPVSSDDVNLLELLEQTREAIGRDAILSIATRRIIPLFADTQIPLIEQIAWRESYYREVAHRVDQIAVMTYDSGMFTARLYQQFVRFQVIQASQAVADTEVQLFIGVPTSEEKTKTHNPTAENITSGLQGVIAGLNDAETRSEVVSGVAIYPYWEMDEEEWTAYASLWLGNE